MENDLVLLVFIFLIFQGLFSGISLLRGSFYKKHKNGFRVKMNKSGEVEIIRSPKGD